MASTVLTTHTSPPPREIHCSRNSSTAPLSHIPRRLASPHGSRRISDLVAPLIDPLHSGVIFTCAGLPTAVAPPNSDSASAPTPPPAKADKGDDSPPTPRLSTAVILSGRLLKSRPHALPAAMVARSMPTPPFPRKKSGEPLRSSLKAKGPPSRGSLTVITDSSSSNSAPATPAHKGVRFHSQLEHVKLFLAKQKPLAVARDGIATDTSGTDSEFAPFIYARDDDLKERPLVMHRIDVPEAAPLADDERDVAVESIDLVGTTVEGVVRVRNLAFEKWLAVRFTLDEWQTTSEVTARFKESLPDGTSDRFVFAIKLADVLSHAEEKTMYLTVRYSVAGREIWDNNCSRNYQVQIAREKVQKVNKEAVVESREESSRADDIADLRRKLEQVVKLGSPSETISGILAQESRRRWESPPSTPSPPQRDATPSFKSECSLAARYDFAASSRTPQRRPPAAHHTPPSSHARTNTPSHPSARPNSVPRPLPHSQAPPHAPRGSPRDPPPEVSYFPVPDLDCDLDSDDAITLVPSLSRRSHSHGGAATARGFGSRNHTRGGGIDLSDAPAVKRTPPTSPIGSPVSLSFATVCQG